MQLIDLNKTTIGSDPEFFVVKNGDAFPSTNLFSGTKDSPEDQGGGFAILKDNVLVEANIPPAKNCDEFVMAMESVKEMINSVLSVGGMKLHSADSMKFKPRYLQHEEANVFGCSSYKNAWKVGDFSAENMSFMPIRVAGFHIHVGYEIIDQLFNKKTMNKYIARAFDYFVVYPARQHFNDEFRAKYYGNYGVFRHTSYGLECRALGGHFTASEYLKWVYNQTIKAIEYCSESENINLLGMIKSPIDNDVEDMNNMYSILKINLSDQLIKL